VARNGTSPSPFGVAHSLQYDGQFDSYACYRVHLNFIMILR